MSYRDMQTAIGAGSQLLGVVTAIPGIGQVAALASAIVGAFSLAGEQERYNRMITDYYRTPVQLGGGFNPGTPASRRQMRLRQKRHFATYFR